MLPVLSIAQLALLLDLAKSASYLCPNPKCRGACSQCAHSAPDHQYSINSRRNGNVLSPNDHPQLAGQGRQTQNRAASPQRPFSPSDVLTNVPIGQSNAGRPSGSGSPHQGQSRPVSPPQRPFSPSDFLTNVPFGQANSRTQSGEPAAKRGRYNQASRNVQEGQTSGHNPGPRGGGASTSGRTNSVMPPGPVISPAALSRYTHINSRQIQEYAAAFGPGIARGKVNLQRESGKPCPGNEFCPYKQSK